MKTLRICLLAVTGIIVATFARAQTADDIINKHVEAIGGKDKISQVNSVYLEISMQIMGNESPTTITILNGKGLKSESEMMGSKVIQVYTDKGGWAINPMMGSSDPAPMPDEQYKAGEDQIYVGDALVDYAAKGSKVELLGQEKIGDTNAYKIKLTNKDSAETIYYIDPSTYYVVQVVKQLNIMGQSMEMVAKYSDYKKTDAGLVMAYASEVNYGQQFSMSSTVQKVEINKEVDPAIFEMPK